jgi:SAM-dependent methyltransferase
MDAIYDGYAAVYDALGQCRWGAGLARFVLDVVLPERGVVPRAALDLACGTGAAALVLAEAGVRAVGLDRSATMLRAARRKAMGAGAALPLVRGDLRAFAFGRSFDLVLCCFDSLNYLTEPRDLHSALRCVRDAVAPGGIFVCDLTTHFAYTGELDGIAHELELGDLEYRWHTSWHAASGLATTEICVITRKNGRSSRSLEHHTQRPYAPVEMAKALQDAGLRLLATYGAGSDGSPRAVLPEPDAPRAIYVAGRAH